MHIILNSRGKTVHSFISEFLSFAEPTITRLAVNIDSETKDATHRRGHKVVKGSSQ